MLTQQAMGWNRKKTESPQSLGSQIYQSKGILQWSQKKKSFTFSKSSSFSFSFSPSLASLYLFEQCLRLGVIGTSSVCLPLQD